MASRPKRKLVTSHEREILLQKFYDDIEENEELFLGNAFVGGEDSDSKFVHSSDTVRFRLIIITKKDVILRMMLKICMMILLSLESRRNCLENKSSRT